METYCTRPRCPKPQNFFPDVEDLSKLDTVQQLYCSACGMPQILSGRYIPMKLLGQGGFGAAFLAIDRYTPSNRRCVVKEFKPPESFGEQALKIARNLFDREAVALERLGTHSQIPDLYAFFPLSVEGFPDRSTQEEYFFLVQEYIEGQDLEKECRQKGKLSQSEILEVLRQILTILQFVHENGSIHRDIKPSNIMRADNGSLYLLDFGAVKQVSTTASVTPSSSTGIHTPGFAPPEQMRGGQIFASSDLYALAATCVALVTGKTVTDLYNPYEDRWDWHPYAEVDPLMAGVIDRMLATCPGDRYESARDALDALNATTDSLQPWRPVAGESTPGARGTTSVPNAAAVPPPVVQPPPQPPVSLPRGRSSFSSLEILAIAAFTGIEGAILAILAFSILPAPGIAMGIWGAAMGGLIFAQYRRAIEKWDLVIIAAISWVVVLLFSPLRDILASLQLTLVLPIIAGALLVAVAALFRLVYLLLSRFLG